MSFSTTAPSLPKSTSRPDVRKDISYLDDAKDPKGKEIQEDINTHFSEILQNQIPYHEKEKGESALKKAFEEAVDITTFLDEIAQDKLPVATFSSTTIPSSMLEGAVEVPLETARTDRIGNTSSSSPPSPSLLLRKVGGGIVATASLCGSAFLLSGHPVFSSLAGFDASLGVLGLTLSIGALMYTVRQS